MYINNILTNLYQAEGLERSYAITGQKIHYKDYLKLMDRITLQIDTLAAKLNNPIQQMHTDSIKKLLKIKQENVIELASIKRRTLQLNAISRPLRNWKSLTILPLILLKCIKT